MIELTNEDNMELMARYPNNHFDLAIVDPPYGIKEDGHRENQTRSKMAKSKKYHNALWSQKKPSKEYFIELKRVSKNQIIWGANHLCDLFNAKSSCWIIWNKKCKGGNHFADAEIAYGSFDTAVRTFDFVWQGMIQGDMKNKEIRIHPTQKPVKLYEWLLFNYAKEGDKIIDTHAGSFSIGIACDNLGFDLTACEIVKEYYNDGLNRLEWHQKQLRLFQ
jgi:site-specific DNA-methyltransferase (adenine-specific)